jgi:CheY-like chemotaxis protein
MTGETILVVEDEGLIALHLTELLEKAGYHVIGPAYSGEMVIRDLGSSPLPDLILMDIALAGSLDGVETARQIHQRYLIPIIFLTAYSDQNHMDQALEISPSGYLRKPVLEDELLTAIRKALAKPVNTIHRPDC